MKTSGDIPLVRITIAIGLVSAAIIAFQLMLMQILSYMQWYHFAYMILSIGLLGFGAAGTFLTIFREKLLQNYYQIFSMLLFITAVLMSTVVIAAVSEPIRFDSLLVFFDWRYAGRLAVSYLVFFLPFFTGALAIGMSFLKLAGQIGKIYFSNLVGSGLGGVFALLLMFLLPVEQLPVPIAGIALIGGLITFPKNTGKSLTIAAIVSICCVMFVLFNPVQLKTSEYKDISKTMLLPDARIEFEKSSPYGILQVVSSPVLRNAPGVSLSYSDTFPVRKVVFNNGNWNGFLVPRDQAKKSILNYTPQSLAYALEKIDKVLILNAGTGENISLALSQNVSDIVATEPNAQIFDLLQNSFSDQNEVKLQQSLARTILVSNNSVYDLIQLPIIGSFFGNSGLNAVEINYELTVEAFHEMWGKLSDKGMISLSCWMDYPVRNGYKIMATINQLLNEENIEPPDQHILAIRSWNAITFLIKKSKFNAEQQKQVWQFCDDLMFDALILPETQEINRGKYNLLQDTLFFENMARLLYGDGKEFIDDYPYRVQPATDNSPFFYQNIRWKGIRQILASFWEPDRPYTELGYVLILFTFIQMIVFAGILIILPLFIRSWKSNSKMWVLVYFGSIGLAFMFVEMVFIQQFTFYFGQPIYAAAASIGILLIASGIGSYCSGFLKITKKVLFQVPLIVAILLLIQPFLLSIILSYTIAVLLPLKIFISIVLIGMTGFFLGIPFPAGIKYLSEHKQTDIPWAWAFNGYFSVISTALASILSVETGFISVMLFATIAYVLAGFANILLKI